jgi:hypothetical protein
MSRSIRTRVARLEGELSPPTDTTLWEVIGGGDPARLDAAGRRLLAQLCVRSEPDEPDMVAERMRAALLAARNWRTVAGEQRPVRH